MDMTQRKSKSFRASHLVLVPVQIFTCQVTLGQWFHLSEFQVLQSQQSYQHAPLRIVYFKAHEKPNREPSGTQSAILVRAVSQCVLGVLQQDHRVGGGPCFALLSLTFENVGGGDLEAVL